MGPVRNPSGFAFMTCGPFSGTNARLLPLLAERFPELEPDEWDMPTWARRHRAILARNLASVLAENGPAIFLDRMRLWGAFFGTSYLSRRIKKEVRERGGSGRYAFTFQTQSIFDGSVPGLPHFVYTDHTDLANTYYPDFDGRPPSKSQVARERLVYQNASVVFTWSAHVTRSLIEHYGMPEDRVECVGAGGNVETAADDGGHPDYTSQRILFIGREWERKGGPILVEAFKAVREAHPEATLVVAGCNPEIDAEGVTVLGEISPDVAREQYVRAALFCMPTRIEPFGVVFVEAQAHALPVVATRIGALPDIVKDGVTGLLVQPDDAAGLAQAISRLLSDPEKSARFGDLGRQRMLDRYTWPHVVDKVESRIRDLIGQPSKLGHD